MVLSAKDRFFAHQIFEIQKAIGLLSEAEFAEKEAIILNGPPTVITQLLEPYTHELSDEVYLEVIEILGIYRLMEDLGVSGNFPGFDGNYECEHLSAAVFVLHTEGKFRESANPRNDYNSHCPMLGHYREAIRYLQQLTGKTECFTFNDIPKSSVVEAHQELTRILGKISK